MAMAAVGTIEVEHLDVEELLAQARLGGEPAWGCLVAQFTGLVTWIARQHRLSSADRADVLQTCWLRLMENLGRIEQPERLGSWLATTARRECLALRRKGDRERPGWSEEVAFGDGRPGVEPPGDAIDTDVMAEERDRALWRAIGGLAQPCPALLRLLLRDPRPSYDEVVATLHMPKGSVGPRRARCLEQLRTRLQAAGHGTAE